MSSVHAACQFLHAFHRVIEQAHEITGVEVDAQIGGIHCVEQTHHFIGGEVDMILYGHSNPVFLRGLHRLAEHSREPLELGFMWLLAESETAADHSYHFRADLLCAVEAGDHVAVGFTIGAAFETVRVPPGVHAVKVVLIQ